jgi:hypothetical protein
MVPMMSVSVAIPGWRPGRRLGFAAGLVPGMAAAPALSAERGLEWSLVVKVVNARNDPHIVTRITGLWANRRFRIPFTVPFGALWRGRTAVEALESADDCLVFFPLLIPPGETYFKVPLASQRPWPYGEWSPWSATDARLQIILHSGPTLRYPAT